MAVVVVVVVCDPPAPAQSDQSNIWRNLNCHQVGNNDSIVSLSLSSGNTVRTFLNLEIFQTIIPAQPNLTQPKFVLRIIFIISERILILYYYNIIYIFGKILILILRQWFDAGR